MKAKIQRMNNVMNSAKQRQKLQEASGEKISFKAALDKEAQLSGYADIENMKRSIWENEAVIAYNPYDVDWRLKPNGNLSIEEHKSIGKGIDELCIAADYRYAVQEHTSFIQDELHRWFKEEYPERITEDTRMVDPYNYFGSEHQYDYDREFCSDLSALHYLSADQKDRFIYGLIRVKSVTGRNYPICKPLHVLHTHIDKAIKDLEKWHQYSLKVKFKNIYDDSEQIDKDNEQ